MKGLFQTILAVLFGLAFEEFYSETAMPEEDLGRILSALLVVALPSVVVEFLLWRGRTSLLAGRAIDTQRYARHVAAAPVWLYLFVVFGCRWPTILVPLGLEGTVLVDHVVVLAPYFAIHAFCVLGAARLRRPLVSRDGSIHAATNREVLPILLDQLRQLGLLVIPLLLLITLLDVVSDTALRTYFRKIPLLAVGFLLFLFGALVIVFPEVFRVSMNLKPLVSGAPLKVRLDEFSRRLGFACRDVLYWPTSRPVFNALIVGALSRFRYVILTEELCKRLTLEEIQTVYAHEVGHGKRAHALYYLLLSAAFVAVLLPIGEWVGQEIVFRTGGRIDAALATTVFVYLPAFALYWRFVLDALSKRFELESDVFGVEATRDPVLFIATLEKVARLARLERGKATMRHFSIEGRVDFLRRAFIERDTASLRAFHERIRRLRKGIVVVSATLLALAGLWLGYQSAHGYASILLDRGEFERASRWSRALLTIRAGDPLALTILAETELEGVGTGEVTKSTWFELLDRADQLRPAERARVLEELESGWLRAVLRERYDVAQRLLERRRALDPSAAADRAETPPLQAVTDALIAGDTAVIEAILEENPRWLRRPALRSLDHRLSKWLVDRKV